MDRTEDGDYYKKPTQYWFINCEPGSNLVWEPIEDTPVMTVAGTGDIVARSLIHPQYARRFIKRYVL